MVNLFNATSLFLYPLKTRGFLIFSGGIERDQWYEMGMTNQSHVFHSPVSSHISSSNDIHDTILFNFPLDPKLVQ